MLKKIGIYLLATIFIINMTLPSIVFGQATADDYDLLGQSLDLIVKKVYEKKVNDPNLYQKADKMMRYYFESNEHIEYLSNDIDFIIGFMGEKEKFESLLASQNKTMADAQESVLLLKDWEKSDRYVLLDMIMNDQYTKEDVCDKAEELIDKYKPKEQEEDKITDDKKKDDATETTKPEEPKPEPQSQLSDIASHWAQANINKLIASDAISGYPDGTFKPDAPIKRAEFATILVKAFNLEAKNGKVFEDTENHWGKDAIATAAAYGIVGGYDDTTFGPEDDITREQMALMIVRAAKLDTATTSKSFADGTAISSWATDAVNTAFENGIISGYPDNTFKPQGNAKRAEAVTVIVNALK